MEVFKNAPDLDPLDHPLPGEVGVGLAIVAADPAEHGADPDSAFLILQDGSDVIIAKAIFRAQVGKATTVEPANAEAVGTEPESAVAVFHNAGDPVVGKDRVGILDGGFGDGKRSKFLSIEATHSVHGTDPERAVAGYNDAPDVVVYQTVLFGKAGEGTSIVPGQPVIRTEPHIALLVLHDRGDATEVEAVFLRVIPQRISIVAHQAIDVGAHPEISSAVLMYPAQMLAKLPLDVE